jgi:hypothetical protein
VLVRRIQAAIVANNLVRHGSDPWSSAARTGGGARHVPLVHPAALLPDDPGQQETPMIEATYTGPERVECRSAVHAGPNAEGDYPDLLLRWHALRLVGRPGGAGVDPRTIPPAPSPEQFLQSICVTSI